MKYLNRSLLFVSILLFMFVSCTHEPGIPNMPPTLSVTCSADTVYFQNKVLPIIVANCGKSGCHDAASHQEDVVLIDYASIMNTGDVRAGDPFDSDLYKVIVETNPSKVMPPPPLPALSQTEKDLIYKWILQGAKNNACNDCDTSVFTYSGAVVPILNTHCKGCHNSGNQNAGLDVTNYNSVKTVALNGKLVGSINHQPGFSAMPEGTSKLSDCKITQIEKWVASGSPNN